MGEVYFRVSKHLSILPSEVIKNKFNPDFKFLIHKYSVQIKQEQKDYIKMKEEMG